MSWITVIWAMVMSACLTLALVHGFVWWRRRDSWAHLLFTLTSLGAAVLAGFDLTLMRAESPEQFASVIRWDHLSAWVIILSLAGFVRVRLRAGRDWLLWTICALRTASLFLNISTGQNLNYRAITGLRHIAFLGETISAPVSTVPNLWILVGQLSSYALVIFVIDASITVWRRGDRRLAVMVGGSIVFFVLAITVQTALIVFGKLPPPGTPSLFYLGIIVVMSYDLGNETLRAAQLAHELHESEARMTLAAEAANLGIWIRDLVRNDIWATERWRRLFGFVSSERIDFNSFLNKLHPEDRAAISQTHANAIAGEGRYETEYRVLLQDGELRWISSRGRVEFNDVGQPTLIRGISMDMTKRKLAELQVVQQRNELAHLSRVTTLGEISGSLAHELNQPLGAILANTEAIEMHLQSPTPQLDLVRTILADIRRDDLRAGEIIHGMRDFLRRREFDMQPIELHEIARDAVRLISTEAANRQITVGIHVSPELPPIMGDCTCLTQVLVNLLVNAMDAMSGCIAPYRHITIQASQANPQAVEILVSDAGIGIPAGDTSRVFEPFHTTKRQGLGLGLAICRSIIEAHGGSISLKNNADRGATARLTLSACLERVLQ